MFLRYQKDIVQQRRHTTYRRYLKKVFTNYRTLFNNAFEDSFLIKKLKLSGNSHIDNCTL